MQIRQVKKKVEETEEPGSMKQTKMRTALDKQTPGRHELKRDTMKQGEWCRSQMIIL